MSNDNNNVVEMKITNSTYSCMFGKDNTRGMVAGDEFIEQPARLNDLTIRIVGHRQSGKSVIAKIILDALKEKLGESVTVNTSLTGMKDTDKVVIDPEYKFMIKIIEDLPSR